MNEKILKKYAELIVRTGANVQPGQVVQLAVSVEQHEFAMMVMEACYKAGAKKVNVDWRSDIGSPANYQQNPSNAFEAASRQTTGANLAGRLALDLFPM